MDKNDIKRIKRLVAKQETLLAETAQRRKSKLAASIVDMLNCYHDEYGGGSAGLVFSVSSVYSEGRAGLRRARKGSAFAER